MGRGLRPAPDEEELRGLTELLLDGAIILTPAATRNADGSGGLRQATTAKAVGGNLPWRI